MKKFIIIPLLFLVGCITIKPVIKEVKCTCHENSVDFKRSSILYDWEKLPSTYPWDYPRSSNLLYNYDEDTSQVYISPFINYSDTITLKYLDGSRIDTDFVLDYIFKDTIRPEPIWDFNVIDTLFESIDDSIVIYQLRYRVIPVTKEIQL